MTAKPETVIDAEGAVGRLMLHPVEGPKTGLSSGIGTQMNPFRNSQSRASNVTAVPLVVMGVVSFIRLVTVAATSPAFIGLGVATEPPDPAVTVAGNRFTIMPLASQLVSVFCPSSILHSFHAMFAVEVILMRSCAAETATSAMEIV